MFQELLASEILAVLHYPFFAEQFLDLDLGGNAGVICAGQPENFFAVHARFPGEDVLDGIIEHMPHVEHAGDIRRRYDDGVGGLG